jgi:UDP-galactopyranose mutase
MDFNLMKQKERPVAKIMTWYTGPIDAYFKNCGLDRLEYRSIIFENKIIYDTEQYQQYPVINYPQNDVDYTRIVEHKKFLNQKSPHTYISFERTVDNGDPYYPVPNKRNSELYENYRKLAINTKDVIFLGRLASYKYYNMDQAIVNSLETVANYIKEYRERIILQNI